MFSRCGLPTRVRSASCWRVTPFDSRTFLMSAPDHSAPSGIETSLEFASGGGVRVGSSIFGGPGGGSDAVEVMVGGALEVEVAGAVAVVVEVELGACGSAAGATNPSGAL